MLPAAPYLIPVSVSALYLLYKYFRSSGRTELSEVFSEYLGSGASHGVPLHRSDDPQPGLPLPLPVTHPGPSDSVSATLDEIRKLNPAVLDEILKFDPGVLDEIRKSDPAVLCEIRKVDPAVLDQLRKLSLEENKEGGEEADRSCNGRETETEVKRENVNEKQIEESGGGGENNNESAGEVEKKVVDKGSSRKCEYPVRPAAGDCSYYLKTGTCKFGSNCKFNHPHRRKKNQNFTSGGSNNGKARSFNNNGGGPSVASTQKLNFLGLPIRPGQKECPYYMRNASCFHGPKCWFTHPDPTGEPELPSGGNDGPPSSEGASSRAAPWPSPSSLNVTPPSQGIYSQNTEWNSYQAPAYLPGRKMPTRPPFAFNSLTETNIYNQHPQRQQVEKFPERPGQPVCSHFLRTGDCKYKFLCKFHHPKTQTAVPPACTLSDKGLPLRPGQNICTQYSHYGICNSAAACPFDHPSLSTSFL